MNQTIIKITLLLIFVLIIAAFFTFDLQKFLTLDYLKTQQQTLSQLYEKNTILMLGAFSLAYILITALSLPVATPLTLLAGALFGWLDGTIVVSFASTIGATLSFLMARFLARDYVQKHYNAQLTKINAGFKQEGAFYLFALRLAPLFPFFMINILMALLPIKTFTFYWISQLGMLPGTVIYVYAGTQLAQIQSLSDISSPSLLIALALLGLFPITTKKLLQWIRKGK